MICIHGVGESRCGSPWGVINLTRWNRLTWEQHRGQKSRAQYGASVIILECLQSNSWVKFSKHIILPAWIFQIYRGSAFQKCRLMKNHAKRKNENAKILNSALPSMSTGNMVAKIYWAKGRILSGWHKMRNGFFSITKREALGLLSHSSWLSALMHE